MTIQIPRMMYQQCLELIVVGVSLKTAVTFKITFLYFQTLRVTMYMYSGADVGVGLAHPGKIFIYESH